MRSLIRSSAVFLVAVLFLAACRSINVTDQHGGTDGSSDVSAMLITFPTPYTYHPSVEYIAGPLNDRHRFRILRDPYDGSIFTTDYARLPPGDYMLSMSYRGGDYKNYDDSIRAYIGAKVSLKAGHEYQAQFKALGCYWYQGGGPCRSVVSIRDLTADADIWKVERIWQSEQFKSLSKEARGISAEDLCRYYLISDIRYKHEATLERGIQTLATWEPDKEGCSEVRKRILGNDFGTSLDWSPGTAGVPTMYEYAIGLEDPTEAWKWLCKAAHQGSAQARFALGSHYRWGRAPVSQDLISAYLWHTLGMAAGSKRSPRALELLKREMTAGQIAAADRLVDEWTPDPAECGVVEVQAGN